MKNIINIGVCEARHQMPVEEYIFPTVISSEDIVNTEKLYDEAWESISRIVSNYPKITDIVSVAYGEDIVVKRPDVEIHLYATGLTVAVIAAIMAAKDMYIPVTVMHYDYVSNEYYSQRIH